MQPRTTTTDSFNEMDLIVSRAVVMSSTPAIVSRQRDRIPSKLPKIISASGRSFLADEMYSKPYEIV